MFPFMVEYIFQNSLMIFKLSFFSNVELTDNIQKTLFPNDENDEKHINIASKSAVNLFHQYTLTKNIVCISKCKVMHHQDFFQAACSHIRPFFII